ncbi:MAG: HAD family phosphatase [Bacteroidetes bacterium]|nr:HAD family phosphatase [Bacteroidota bacterium]
MPQEETPFDFTYLSNIKNIIFDLGNVIYNIDTLKTRDAFLELGAGSFEQIYTITEQSELFNQFETGKIDRFGFYEGVRNYLDMDLEDEQIKIAWNAMLLGLPATRLRLLLDLKSKFRTFLFSNTNELHIEAVTADNKANLGIDSLEPYFEKLYYSHLINLRKPDPAAFDFIIKDNELNRKETLFVDDGKQHIEGARKAGLQTVLITEQYTFEKLYSELMI